MTRARPIDLEELSAFFRGRPEGAALAVTGGAGEVSPGAGRALEAERVELLSTAAFDGVVSYEPRDLVITVGAGTRLETLRAILAEAGQWLPPAEPGVVDPLPGSVGGLVAAGRPGPFDLLLGPVRRHLLACRVVSRDGTARRWGRPVMKNVAGYAIHSLWAGSRGRLGVLVEASLRTWPAPVEAEVWTLAPGTEANGNAAGLQGGRDEGADPRPALTLSLAARLATGPAEQAPLPDAAVWTWRAAGAPEGRLELRLLGTRASVAARRARLRAWAEARGARLERWTEPEPPADIAAAPGGPGPAGGGEPERGSPEGGGGPERGSPESGRSPRRAVLRMSVPPSRLPALAGRVLGALPRAGASAEAYPLVGVLRCAWEREPGSAEGEATAGAVLAAAGDAAVAVERGGPFEHARAASRREPAVAGLEERLVRALGGGPRAWVADYV